MVFSVFGALVALLGLLILWRGTMLHMLLFVMGCTLLGGSAAFVLTALGGSSITPAHFALFFLVVRLFLPGEAPTGLKDSLSDNRWLVALIGYAVVGAFLLPNIFKGAMQVTPTKLAPDGPFTVPLGFTTSNITVSVYLIATLLASIAAHAAVRAPGAARTFARAGAIIGATHATLGILSVALAATPAADLFAMFRNSGHNHLTQSFQGYVRMSGIFAEPAAFAGYGVAWLVFLTEAWLRGVLSRWTGRAALLLFVALIASTSTTAYVGIMAYGGLLLARQLVHGGSIPISRLVRLLFMVGLGVVVVLGAMVLFPSIASLAYELIEGVTVNKLDSTSGVERAEMARQGFEAVRVSWGLGVGPGSFRSSSLLTALLGSAGLLGLFAFLAHLARLFKPLRLSTWAPVGSTELAVGASASWAAIVMLIPASFAAPSMDPGLLWGIFGGVALALRRAPATLGRHERVMFVAQGARVPVPGRPLLDR